MAYAVHADDDADGSPDDLTDAERAGWCLVIYRQGAPERVRLVEWDRLNAALDRADAWYSGIGPNGERVRFTLRGVLSLTRWDAESHVRERGEREQERARKRAAGWKE